MTLLNVAIHNGHCPSKWSLMNQPLPQTLRETQIFKKSSATRCTESTRVPLYFKSWKRWRTEEWNIPVCWKLTKLHIYNTDETLMQWNSIGLLHVSKDPSCPSLMGFERVLSCCPAKFCTVNKMPHVFPSHTTKTFLTTHMNILTLPQWEKILLAPGQPSASH